MRNRLTFLPWWMTNELWGDTDNTTRVQWRFANYSTTAAADFILLIWKQSNWIRDFVHEWHCVCVSQSWWWFNKSWIIGTEAQHTPVLCAWLSYYDTLAGTPWIGTKCWFSVHVYTFVLRVLRALHCTYCTHCCEYCMLCTNDSSAQKRNQKSHFNHVCVRVWKVVSVKSAPLALKL